MYPKTFPALALWDFHLEKQVKVPGSIKFMIHIDHTQKDRHDSLQVASNQTPGSSSSAFEQNTLSFLICSDGNGALAGMMQCQMKPVVI